MTKRSDGHAPACAGAGSGGMSLRELAGHPWYPDGHPGIHPGVGRRPLISEPGFSPARILNSDHIRTFMADSAFPPSRT